MQIVFISATQKNQRPAVFYIGAISFKLCVGSVNQSHTWFKYSLYFCKQMHTELDHRDHWFIFLFSWTNKLNIFLPINSVLDDIDPMQRHLSVKHGIKLQEINDASIDSRRAFFLKSWYDASFLLLTGTAEPAIAFNSNASRHWWQRSLRRRSSVS